MSLRRVGSGCMGFFGVALLIHACFLPLIGLLVLAAWGAILLVTAHPVHPMAITGVVVEATDWFQGKTHEDTAVTLQKDGRNYRVYLPGLHPPVPRDRPRAGERITLWFDPETNWVNLSETRVLGLSLGGEPMDRPAHRREDFDDPESDATRQRLVGAGLLGVVALIVGLSALWERIFSRRSLDLLEGTRT